MTHLLKTWEWRNKQVALVWWVCVCGWRGKRAPYPRGRRPNVCMKCGGCPEKESAVWRKGNPTKSGWYEARWTQNVFGKVINYKGRVSFDSAGKKWGRQVIEWRPIQERA